MFRFRHWLRLAVGLAVLFAAVNAPAEILWSDLGATTVHESGAGVDILEGALKRDDSSTNALYFKFHVDPLSDAGTEYYFAAFQLYDGNAERLGVGNSSNSWAYSAFNTTKTENFSKIAGDVDLRSARSESAGPGVSLHYELPRRGIGMTIVFKVQYVAGSEDLITVWLDPELSPGSSEESQPAELTTTFYANASFDQIRLRHGGGGGGWIFSDMAIGTAFNDFVAGGKVEAGEAKSALTTGGGALTFRAWQREQGLPNNSVRALAQTSDGYLWIGTDAGITRFDGVRFVSFGLREGWRNGRIRCFLAAADGSLWVGTVDSGLARCQDGRFTTFTTENHLPSDSVTALVEDDQHRLWVGTESGLVVLTMGSISIPAEAEQFKGRSISALLRDKKGRIWTGVSGLGVFQLEGKKFVPVVDASVERLLTDPHCLLEDREGRLWVGAGEDFVLCREGESWRRYRMPRHLSRPYVNVLAEQADGTVWAGSVREGLYEFKAGKLTVVSASAGLSDNFIQSLLADREGNLWVGTASGLNRLRRGNLAIFGQSEGLGYGPVQGLAEVSPGVVWACKPNDGIYQLEEKGFSKLVLSDPARRYADVSAILMARDGACWVGGSHGVYRFQMSESKEWEEDTMELPEQAITAFTQLSDGSLWAGTAEGKVWVRGGTEWTVRPALSQNHAVTAIVGSPDGTMWLGTARGGLHQFARTAHVVFDRRNRLLSDQIRTLYLDKSSDLWIGTAGGGLSRYHDGEIHTFTTSEGLPDNTVSQILEDDSGRLWLGTDRGIACVAKRELTLAPTNKSVVLIPQLFGRPEGMSSEECTSGFFPAGFKTKSGHLWFSTTKGIVVADPRPAPEASGPPSVVIEELSVDGEPVESKSRGEVRAAAPASASIVIPPGRRSLEFRYTGLSLIAPERIHFRYRLEPWERDWVDAGTRRTVTYGYIPAGEYKFRVAACNSDGVWNTTEAEMPIKVLRHYWQSKWFIGLVTLGLAGSVAGAARFVEKRKHQRRLRLLEQERALERERARIAQDLHDDLGSSLTRLSLLSDLLITDKNDPEQVQSHATKIIHSAGQSVRSLEEIVWALRPGSDTLQGLIDYIAHFANELFDGNGTRCRLDFPHDLPARSLPPEMRHNIFLIMKEALTNVCKHAHATEVRVQSSIQRDRIEFVVQDDGQGFEQAAANPPAERHGLGNMQRRAEAMHGSFRLETTPGKGTTVRLSVPFREEERVDAPERN